MRSDGQQVTRSQLLADLRVLGVQEGAMVMLHAAVGMIGWIVGGPRVVLDATIEALTPHGTLAMLTS